MKPNWPEWVDRRNNVNLRQVAKNLYVGAITSPSAIEWEAVVSLAVPAFSVSRHAKRWLLWPFTDGDRFPEGCLTSIEAFCRDREGPVLIHCVAGLSRSVSAAYALLRVQHRVGQEEALRRVRASRMYPMQETLASVDAWVDRQLGRKE